MGDVITVYHEFKNARRLRHLLRVIHETNKKKNRLRKLRFESMCGLC